LSQSVAINVAHPVAISILLSWTQWQRAVLALLRADFADVLQNIGFDEVDWAAWRSFYDEGRTPRSAIDRALERDF
jgi:ligand-binding SRPBCC domain-containing protein